ncbi:hypothetical protein ACD589_12805 [Rhizobium sp. 814_E9_N1_1]|nr:hypothetical protein [Rhizobium leguminosarum]
MPKRMENAAMTWFQDIDALAAPVAIIVIAVVVAVLLKDIYLR